MVSSNSWRFFKEIKIVNNIFWKEIKMRSNKAVIKEVLKAGFETIS